MHKTAFLSSVLVLPHTKKVTTTSYGMYRILGYLVKYKYKKMQNIDKWPCTFMNTDMLYFFL